MPLRGSPDNKFRQVLREFKNKNLHSGSKKGPKVTSRKQAIAIAFKQSGKDKK